MFMEAGARLRLARTNDPETKHPSEKRVLKNASASVKV